jgi:type III pantothenate kinase
VNPETFIAISVGNTRSHVGLFERGCLAQSRRFANDDVASAVQYVIETAAALAGGGTPVVIASVNDPVADRITSAVTDQMNVEIYRVGEDLPVPIGRCLDPETITGVDRLLNAAAAFARLRQACVVVDAGSAVTVDFVDGEGTFHGGAIAPGASMQLQALHAGTAQLPQVDFAAPIDEAFGRNTAQAMLQGVYYGIRGLVWRLTERYAERYGAYPQVIATGGDAALLFEGDGLVDRIVPDLTLLGIAEAVHQALGRDESDNGGRNEPRTA